MTFSSSHGRYHWRGPTANRGRGGFSSRGGRGAYPKRQQRPMPDIVKHPLGDLLISLSTEDLQSREDSPTGAATITDYKVVTSYNWINEKTPTILVPGKPPLWTPPKVVPQLKQDCGDVFRDPNAARFPSYPTEPAVQAILLAEPEFPTSTIDIFACGSTMSHLLRFVRHIDKAFRFSVEVVGRTVFFIRKENSPKELINDLHGYGQAFPEAYTTWEADVRGSETHQRLIQYIFGGLKCLIRFECDGYLRDSSDGNAAPRPLPNGPASEADNILHALRATAVSQTTTKTDEILTVRASGSNIPQNSVFDLKTRSRRSNNNDIDMSDILPSLYIKQIPNFIVAYHNGHGVFDRGIHIKKLKNDLAKWEAENKTVLEDLAILLLKITEIAKADDRGRLEIYSPSVDRLEIRQQFGDGVHALPRSLREEWSTSGSDSTSEIFQDIEGVDIHDKYENLVNNDFDSDDDSKDYTACSPDACGYCGNCSY